MVAHEGYALDTSLAMAIAQEASWAVPCMQRLRCAFGGVDTSKAGAPYKVRSHDAPRRARRPSWGTRCRHVRADFHQTYGGGAYVKGRGFQALHLRLTIMEPWIVLSGVALCLVLVAGRQVVVVLRKTKQRKAYAQPPAQEGPLMFYHRNEPYYEFTNFSPHPIQFEGKMYPTSEHLFQAHKFLSTRPDLAERIRNAKSSRAALEEATRLRSYQRKDWFSVNISVMDEVIEAKFTQNADLKQLLLDTGDREIIEDSPVDSFWGCGADRKGRNELGKALMRLRDKLRRQSRL